MAVRFFVLLDFNFLGQRYNHQCPVLLQILKDELQILKNCSPKESLCYSGSVIPDISAHLLMNISCMSVFLASGCTARGFL